MVTYSTFVFYCTAPKNKFKDLCCSPKSLHSFVVRSFVANTLSSTKTVLFFVIGKFLYAGLVLAHLSSLIIHLELSLWIYNALRHLACVQGYQVSFLWFLAEIYNLEHLRTRVQHNSRYIYPSRTLLQWITWRFIHHHLQGEFILAPQTHKQSRPQ